MKPYYIDGITWIIHTLITGYPPNCNESSLYNYTCMHITFIHTLTCNLVSYPKCTDVLFPCRIMVDRSSQFEKQLSAQWHQIANKMGVPCIHSSNSQPIKERLSQAIEYLVDSGESREKALQRVKNAVNMILGANSETEMDKLLELEVHVCRHFSSNGE